MCTRQWISKGVNYKKYNFVNALSHYQINLVLHLNEPYDGEYDIKFDVFDSNIGLCKFVECYPFKWIYIHFNMDIVLSWNKWGKFWIR